MPWYQLEITPQLYARLVCVTVLMLYGEFSPQIILDKVHLVATPFAKPLAPLLNRSQSSALPTGTGCFLRGPGLELGMKAERKVKGGLLVPTGTIV